MLILGFNIIITKDQVIFIIEIGLMTWGINVGQLLTDVSKPNMSTYNNDNN